MLTLKEFINKHNGKYLEAYDATNPNQCYDLITEWCWNLNMPRPKTLYAHQIYDNPPPGFIKVFNSPSATPVAGDIIIWSGDYNGGAGHTAIATGKCDLNTFDAFSQNDPLNSPCVLRTYNYNHVRGWIRPENLPVNIPTMTDRRQYWFDLMNKVIFNKPHEELNDEMIKDFAKSYPTQLKRSGLWDLLATKAGFDGNTNNLSVDELFALIISKAPTDCSKEIAKERTDCQKRLKDQIANIKTNIMNYIKNV